MIISDCLITEQKQFNCPMTTMYNRCKVKSVNKNLKKENYTHLNLV